MVRLAEDSIERMVRELNVDSVALKALILGAPELQPAYLFGKSETCLQLGKVLKGITDKIVADTKGSRESRTASILVALELIEAFQSIMSEVKVELETARIFQKVQAEKNTGGAVS